MRIKLYSLTINTLNKQRICSTSENRFPISVPKKIQNRAKQLKKRLVTRWCKSNIMQQGRKEVKHWQVTCFLDFLFIYIFPKTGSLEVRLNSTLLISYLYPDIEIWDTASGPLPLAVIKSLTITAELCQGFSLYVMWFLCVIFLQELSDKITRFYSRTKKPKRFKSNKFCHYVVITLASFICYIMVRIKKILSKELKRSKNKSRRKKGKGQQPDIW